jgi:4-aminobutyrate aminotransferase
MGLPHIKTKLPGPKTQALLEKDARYLSPSYTRGYPLSVASGQGALVTDLDDNVFLDFCAGIAVCATGHSHPQVVAAIQTQAAKFLHMSGTDFYYEGMADLAERLAKNTPGSSDKKVFFGNSGAEANEAALKLARYHSRRPNFISFYGGFHGRTFGAMSVSASKAIQRSRFSPLMAGCYFAHYPNAYRNPFGAKTVEDCADACLDYIRKTLFKQIVLPEEVAAFIIEPIQGEGGYLIPPPFFLTELQALAHQHGILIIADEIQCGMGRTGKLWASQHIDGFEPDILTSAKGLASGMPLGACIARSELMDWPPGAHATTFGGNPVSCAAALTTLDLLEGGLIEQARIEGAYLKQALQQISERCDVLGEVRGEGLMLGLEIVQSKASRQVSPNRRNAIVDACFEKGLLVLGCGESTIRLSPPLVIDRVQSDCALQILDDVLAKQA